jgi:hypothetical protein
MQEPILVHMATLDFQRTRFAASLEKKLSGYIDLTKLRLAVRSPR